VRTVASPLGHCRVGIVVPRHKHSAVDRNRLKRRLRELVRLRLLPGAPSHDVVIRARREAYDARFEQLARDVERAARELGRWEAGGGKREAGGNASLHGTNPPSEA